MLSSSMVAGLVTTTVINPADVVRAHMQAGGGGGGAAAAAAAAVQPCAPRPGALRVATGIAAAHGPAGFMRGWTAAYARTGPQTLIIFSVSELLRPLLGLSAIGSC